jgi:RNA polymerase sigma factor (sigma-70 family)
MLDVEAIYRGHGHAVLRRAHQILGSIDEAAEVLQEVFADLLARRDQLDAPAPSTLLYTATTNACLRRLRDRTRDHAAPPAGVAAPDTLAILRSELARLPEEEARAAVYYHGDGMTHAEIAEVLGCSRRHVGNLLARVAYRIAYRGAA